MVAGKITFSGPAVFMDNDAGTFDGGALYLISFSQLILFPEAHLNFTNNTGRYKIILFDQLQPTIHTFTIIQLI